MVDCIRCPTVGVPYWLVDMVHLATTIIVCLFHLILIHCACIVYTKKECMHEEIKVLVISISLLVDGDRMRLNT